MPNDRNSRFWSEARERGFSSVYAVDFEGSSRSGVVEYGVVEFGPEGIAGAWTALCTPRSPLTAIESQTHGLGDKDFAQTEPFAHHWELFKNIRSKGPLLAHAAGVEDRFLSREWPSPGEVPDWLQSKVVCNWEWGPWLDSLALSRKGSPQADSHSLAIAVERAELSEAMSETALRICPESRRKWHAALYDALASALLFLQATWKTPDWGLWRFRVESISSESERTRSQQRELW